MNTAEAISPREVTLDYADGSSHVTTIVDREVPYPEGKLIVSRTDTRGIITHANQAFIDMSAYSREELIGTPHYILRHPDMPAAAFKDLWDTISAGRKWHGYVKNLRKDGACYWVHAVVVPNVRDGEIIGYSSVRRKPSRNKVREAEKLYREMQQ